jgi:hypothetical protein
MMNKSIFLSLFLLHLLVIPSLPDLRIQGELVPPIYDYIKETRRITTNYGVRLSAAFYRPVLCYPEEMIKEVYVSNLSKYIFPDIIICFFAYSY